LQIEDFRFQIGKTQSRIADWRERLKKIVIMANLNVGQS
jgi:hypothetical protein